MMVLVKIINNTNNKNICGNKRINKDYNLPLVRIYHKINNKTHLKELELIISFISVLFKYKINHL